MRSAYALENLIGNRKWAVITIQHLGFRSVYLHDQSFWFKSASNIGDFCIRWLQPIAPRKSFRLKITSPCFVQVSTLFPLRQVPHILHRKTECGSQRLAASTLVERRNFWKNIWLTLQDFTITTPSFRAFGWDWNYQNFNLSHVSVNWLTIAVRKVHEFIGKLISWITFSCLQQHFAQNLSEQRRNNFMHRYKQPVMWLQWRSQPKNLGRSKYLGVKIFYFRLATVFALE